MRATTAPAIRELIAVNGGNWLALLGRSGEKHMVFLVGPPGFEPGFSAPKAGIERQLALVGADSE